MENRNVTLKDSYLYEFSGEHLAYELEMFFATAAEHLIGSNHHNQNVHNALLEAFAIHTRTLLFFFYPAKVRSDDAIADHFLTDGINWKEIRPKLSSTLGLARKRTGKEIAHLTYSRSEIAEDMKGWDFGRIILDFKEVLQVFATNSSANKLHPHFSEVGNFWLQVFIRRGILNFEEPQP